MPVRYATDNKTTHKSIMRNKSMAILLPSRCSQFAPKTHLYFELVPGAGFVSRRIGRLNERTNSKRASQKKTHCDWKLYGNFLNKNLLFDCGRRRRCRRLGCRRNRWKGSERHCCCGDLLDYEFAIGFFVPLLIHNKSVKNMGGWINVFWLL